MRSLGWWAYGVVRPVVRPVMGRLRTFLTGRLHEEIGALRGDVAALREVVERQRAEAERSSDERVREAMAQALATLALDRER